MPSDPKEKERLDLEETLEKVLAPIFAGYIIKYKQAIRSKSEIFPGSEMVESLRYTLEQHYKRTMREFRASAFAGLDPVESDEFAQDIFDRSFAGWVASTSALRAAIIAETTRMQGERAKVQALEAAASENEVLTRNSLAIVAASILKRELDIRRKTISITETQAGSEATKFFKSDSVSKSPTLSNTYVVFKTWNTILDGRERPTHNSANSQEVANSNPFSVGGASLMYPGDPSGPAKEIINCRCFMTSKVVRINQ